MRSFTLLKRYWFDQSGATAIEYAIIGSIVMVGLTGILATGGAVDSLYSVLEAIGEAMDNARSDGESADS